MHQQFCFTVSKRLQNFSRTPSRAAQMSSGMASSRSKKLKPASALFLGLCFCVAAIFSAFESLAFAKNILVTGAGGRTGILVVGELLDASTCNSCNHVMSNRTVDLMIKCRHLPCFGAHLPACAQSYLTCCILTERERG